MIFWKHEAQNIIKCSKKNRVSPSLQKTHFQKHHKENKLNYTQPFKQSIFVDISNSNVASFDDVLYFAEKFKLDYDLSTVNAFSGKFLDCKKLNDHNIPNSVLQNACYYYDEKTKYYRVDILEKYKNEMKDYIGKYQFDLLFKVQKLVLVLPQLNISEERVFTMLKKNKIPFREMVGFSTSGSILTVKLAKQGAAKFKPDKLT